MKINYLTTGKRKLQINKITGIAEKTIKMFEKHKNRNLLIISLIQDCKSITIIGKAIMNYYSNKYL